MSLKKTVLFAIILAMLGCTQNQKLTLVKNNKSNYEIVLPAQPDEIIEKAGNKLQTYLEKISSVKIPIVNESELNEKKRQIFVSVNPEELTSVHSISIKTEGENLIITGGSGESVLFAVYEFLEMNLGCKWYSPTVEKIPTSKTISIGQPLNYQYTPEITTRTVHSRLFYENPDFAHKMHVTTDAFPGYVPTARVHTFHRFVPEQNYYYAHPEYYALRGEKRLHTQLCLTNKEVLQIVTDSVKAYFERYPDASVISVSQDDNTQNCQCEDCKKIDDEEGSASGSMIRFVNAVAESFPDKTISTLAYQYTRKPSITKPAVNVLITLCSIECDRSAPIADKSHDFAQDLKGWKKITENIRIWDYTTQFTNFLAPFPNIHTLQPNIQFFRNNNATWVFEQHSHHPSELFELRSYLTAKLLWNPDLDANEIINEFVQGYYAEAGKYVTKYIDVIHEEIQKDKDFFLFLYGDPAQAFNSFLNPELLKQYNTYFDDAEKVVENKPNVLQRVRTSRISTDYAMLEMARNGKSPDFQLLENGKISKDVELRVSRFKESCQNSNITLMNEMGYTVEEYLNLYKETLIRAGLPNIANGKKVTLHTQPKKYADENPQALTDGALGGSNFYANWLGFEGNNMEAVIDLGSEMEFSNISTGFLQVTNHIVFFPEEVSYFYSNDLKTFTKLETVANPISKESKKNDVEYFTSNFAPTKARYINIIGKNVAKAPFWHNAAGLPAWIFIDEVIVN
ncbi:MAG: DUF4838 domain-containing protein [Bacteroidetes bacterium]|nr:DUF4838 domain-containing protein [Bacteroidota bacterium]